MPANVFEIAERYLNGQTHTIDHKDVSDAMRWILRHRATVEASEALERLECDLMATKNGDDYDARSMKWNERTDAVCDAVRAARDAEGR